MTQKAIFFDLDGTLTDSGEGIMNCATLALNHFGIPVPDRQALRVFVGPPLERTFVKFGIPADQVTEAIRVFRSRYTTVGKFENFPYPGIQEMLAALQAQGHRLFVATSKPETMAVEVLTHFGLNGYFEKICGATMDGSRSEKADVIRYLLEQTGDMAGIVMVGDTAFDVIGAAEHSIPCIGVSWGYGLVEDMKNAGAIAIVDTPQQLLEFINR